MSYIKTIRAKKDTGKKSSLLAIKEFINQNSSIGSSLGIESIERGEDAVIDRADEATTVIEQNLSEIIDNSEVVENSEDGAVVDVADTELTESQVDAATGVMALAGDGPSMEHYMSGGIGLSDQFVSFSHAGSSVIGERVSNEQFVDHELKNHLNISLLFNVRGQRQGRLAELFFRTTTLSPEAPYVKFELFVPNIVRNRKRVINSVQAHQYVRLLDAAINPSLLNDRSTEAVPVHQAGATSTAAYFMADYIPESVTIAEDTFTTAPLAINKTVNLINLSARPGLVASGEMDNTDGLEAAIRTAYLVAQVTQGGNPHNYRFPVSNLTEMQFQPADNSTGDKVVMSFSGIFGVITPETLSVTSGTAMATLLSPTYDGYKIYLAASVSGEFNLNTGVGVISGGDLTVAGYTVGDSDVMETTNNAAITSALGNLAIGGYVVRARRTNLNKRVEGTLLASLPIREAYRVELGAPLLAQLPLGVANTERAQEIATNTLITASRIRNNDLAITKLLDTAETMEGQSVLTSAVGTQHYVECEGIARHLIRPCFIKRSVDFDDGTVVSSLKSHERAADVSAAITNHIRTVSTRMWYQSNLESAFQYAADQGNAVKPVLAIGTSPLISQHLIVTGDTRLVGVRFDYEATYDVDARMNDKIFLAFVSKDHQYLTFGQHLWVPELVTNLPISREGRTVRELQVQPRNRHLVTLPVLGLIECTNLEKALIDPNLPTIPFEEVTP